MRLPGFSAECSLAEVSLRYGSSRGTLTGWGVQKSGVELAALARELSFEEMHACYFACRAGAGALGHRFCAASCF